MRKSLLGVIVFIKRCGKDCWFLADLCWWQHCKDVLALAYVEGDLISGRHHVSTLLLLLLVCLSQYASSYYWKVF